MTFSSINGSVVVYPELNDLKHYKDKIIWVMVTKSPSHPFRYMPPVFWSKYNARETHNIDEVLHFSKRESHAFFYFVRPKDRNLPTRWIPHVIVIQQDLCLFLVNMSACTSPGKISFFSSKFYFFYFFIFIYFFLLTFSIFFPESVGDLVLWRSWEYLQITR